MAYNHQGMPEYHMPQSARVVSFSFKIEKSQLMTPKHQDYVLVNKDGTHCAGSAKFNGVTSDTQMNFADPSYVSCEVAPEYMSSHQDPASSSTTAFPSVSYIKAEPNTESQQQSKMNDSGFTEDDPNLFVNQPESMIPKIEPR